MWLLTDSEFDAVDYVERARKKALAGVSGGLDRHGGRLLGSEIVEDENGWWFAVRAAVHGRPDVEIRHSRLLLHIDGPDKDAEVEGIIYGSAFVERLLTSAPRQESIDGVITL